MVSGLGWSVVYRRFISATNNSQQYVIRTQHFPLHHIITIRMKASCGGIKGSTPGHIGHLLCCAGEWYYEVRDQALQLDHGYEQLKSEWPLWLLRWYLNSSHKPSGGNRDSTGSTVISILLGRNFAFTFRSNKSSPSPTNPSLLKLYSGLTFIIENELNSVVYSVVSISCL